MVLLFLKLLTLNHKKRWKGRHDDSYEGDIISVPNSGKDNFFKYVN